MIIISDTEAAVRKTAKRISEYRHAQEEEKRQAEAKAREDRLAHQSGGTQWNKR